MDAAETIQAAIDKLDRGVESWSYSDENFEVRTRGTTVAEHVMPPDGVLIVSLRASVSGQVAVLRRGHHAITCSTNRAENQAWVSAALILARSILGEVTPDAS